MNLTFWKKASFSLIFVSLSIVTEMWDFCTCYKNNKDQTVCYNFVYRAPLHSRATTANTHFAAKKQLRMHKKAFSAAAARRIWQRRIWQQQRRRAPGMIIIIEELRIFSHSWHLIGKLWLLTLYDTGVIHKWRHQFFFL